MTSRLDSWTPLGTLVKRRGRTSITQNSRASLVIGVDKPNASTTGVLPGSTLTSQSGNLTMATAGQVLQNVDLAGNLTVTAANCQVLNCRIRGNGTAPGSGALVTCTGSGVSNLLLQDTEVAPDAALNVNGITGHHFTLKRSNVHHVTDCININGAGPYASLGAGWATGVVIEQSWLHDLGWLTASGPGIVHPSDNYTHNDIIQIFGGTGTTIRGSVLDAHYAKQWAHWMVTNPASEPYTSVALNSLPDGGPYRSIPDRGDGNEASGRYSWLSVSCMLLNNSQGYSGGFTVTDNWFYGGNFSVNGGGNTYPGGGQTLGDWLRNRFDRSQGDQGSGGNTTKTLAFYSSWSGHLNAPTSGADKNYYESDGSAITVRP